MINAEYHDSAPTSPRVGVIDAAMNNLAHAADAHRERHQEASWEAARHIVDRHFAVPGHELCPGDTIDHVEGGLHPHAIPPMANIASVAKSTEFDLDEVGYTMISNTDLGLAA